MAFIKQSDLRASAAGPSFAEGFRTMQEAKTRGRRTTVFLSHSHRDRTLALGLKNKLKQQAVDLYIDWEDTAMPDRPSRETAEAIQKRIVGCDIFLLLATQNSLSSRWCPWEMGYADGKKPLDRIVIVPTTDDKGNYHGNEYLELYPQLSIPDGMVTYAVFPAGRNRGVLLEQYASTIRSP
jgi:hypothetical protein